LFSFISSNWRNEPLRDYETIVNLIAKTTTAKGLRVACRLDRLKYPTGRKVTVEEMKQVNIYPDKFHGEWNYVIKPHHTLALLVPAQLRDDPLAAQSNLILACAFPTQLSGRC